MAFKIKDLMINIAASALRAGGGQPVTRTCPTSVEEGTHREGCADQQTHLPGCIADQTHLPDCIGHQTHLPDCIGHQTHVPVCIGRQTHLPDCIGRQTHLPECAGHQTHHQARIGNDTDVALCVGGRTDIVMCIGGKTFEGGEPGRGPLPVCAIGTRQTHAWALSPQCAPGEILDGLNAIKAELQAELARLDNEIREVEDSLKPKTVAEVEDLQTKLQEALEELGKMKADMEKS
jgi:hypothetical protein